MKPNRIYTQETLTIIGPNGVNVALTAMQTAMPQRTLSRSNNAKNTGNANFWRKKKCASPPTTEPIKLPALSKPYGIIRERLLAHIMHLTENLTHHPA